MPAPVLADDDVRRLDVAVQEPRAVQDRELVARARERLEPRRAVARRASTSSRLRPSTSSRTMYAPPVRQRAERDDARHARAPRGRSARPPRARARRPRPRPRRAASTLSASTRPLTRSRTAQTSPPPPAPRRRMRLVPRREDAHGRVGHGRESTLPWASEASPAGWACCCPSWASLSARAPGLPLGLLEAVVAAEAEPEAR